MSTATLTFDDGKTATLTFPEGMSEEQKMQKVMQVKQEYLAAKPLVQKPVTPAEAAKPQEPQRTPARKILDGLQEDVDNQLGGADLLKTIVGGAVAQPVAGIAGILGGVLGADPEMAIKWYEATESALTPDLWTKRGKEMAVGLQQAVQDLSKKKFIPKVVNEGTRRPGEMPQLSPNKFSSPEEIQLRQGVKDFSLAVAGGNPEIATAIETTLVGFPEVVTGKVKVPALKSVMETNIARQKVQNSFNDLAAAAEKHGYKLTNDELPQSIVEVAERLAPERHAAANIDEVQESVIKANKEVKKNVDDLYTEARSKDAYTMVKPVQVKIMETHQKLVDKGFDVEMMPTYQRRLKEARDLMDPEKGPVPTKMEPVAEQQIMNLKHLNMLERRVSNDLRGKKPNDYTAEDTALLNLRNAYRDHMNHIFDNAAIYGDQSAKDAWVKATAAAANHRRLFKVDTAIKNMVQKEATPELVYQWLMGTSSMGAKKQAGQTLTKLVEILGPNHPSLVLMRHAAIRDAVMPLLLDTGPNYKQAVRNIDKLLNQNPTVVEQLGIPVKEMELLKRASTAATKLKPAPHDWTNRSWIVRGINRIVFGHQIARKGQIVQTAHKITDAILKTGALTRDELVRHMMDVDHNVPIVQPKGKIWTEIMLRGAAANAADEQDEDSDAR